MQSKITFAKKKETEKCRKIHYPINYLSANSTVFIVLYSKKAETKK
jgi:hypothetical protein